MNCVYFKNIIRIWKIKNFDLTYFAFQAIVPYFCMPTKKVLRALIFSYRKLFNFSTKLFLVGCFSISICLRFFALFFFVYFCTLFALFFFTFSFTFPFFIYCSCHSKYPRYAFWLFSAALLWFLASNKRI